MNGQCPWCEWEGEPIENDDAKGERDPKWKARNPWKCPECGEVGDGEDWFGAPEPLIDDSDRQTIAEEAEAVYPPTRGEYES